MVSSIFMSPPSLPSPPSLCPSISLPPLSSLPLSLHLPPPPPTCAPESADDTVYFSAGFFQGNDGVGRHFSISYQNVTVTSDPSSLQTTELFRTEDNNILWLRFPVTFVGSYRADYSPVPPANMPSDYQFWFVFLRENFFNSDVIYSHLVRICRNDRGSNSTSDRIFNTYMKARIFCERDKPSGREFTSTLDYQYNSISEGTSFLVCLSVRLSICLSVCQSVCLSVCLSVCWYVRLIKRKWKK